MKAMGEMLLGRQHGEVPVAIVRPSIVESALSEPYAGWVEGIRMCDPIVIAYGKGQLRGFVGDADGVLDVVPVDHVVNAMLAAMPRHARTAGEHAHFGDDAGGFYGVYAKVFKDDLGRGLEILSDILGIYYQQRMS